MRGSSSSCFMWLRKWVFDSIRWSLQTSNWLETPFIHSLPRSWHVLFEIHIGVNATSCHTRPQWGFRESGHHGQWRPWRVKGWHAGERDLATWRFGLTAEWKEVAVPQPANLTRLTWQPVEFCTKLHFRAFALHFHSHLFWACLCFLIFWQKKIVSFDPDAFSPDRSEAPSSPELPPFWRIQSFQKASIIFQDAYIFLSHRNVKLMSSSAPQKMAEGSRRPQVGKEA